jgi:hypothetical protein
MDKDKKCVSIGMAMSLTGLNRYYLRKYIERLGLEEFIPVEGGHPRIALSDIERIQEEVQKSMPGYQ